MLRNNVPDTLGVARLAGTDLRSLLPLKFLIFVVDIGQAARYADEVPASIEQAQQSIRQSLGLKQQTDKKRLETIFAGYDGMIRSPLESDSQFKLKKNKKHKILNPKP